MTTHDEDQQLQSVFRALGVVNEWESLTGGSVPSGKWLIEPGSDLAEDDHQSHPFEVSHAAWAALSAGCGRVAQRNAFGTCWREAVGSAGLPKGTRFHDLRHFYASTLIAANLNPKVIQARLGHATITETMDTYGRLFPDAEDLGRGAIDAILGEILAEQSQNQEVK